MIIVDVRIPIIDETYDFYLDENAVIENVLLELTGVLVKKTGNANNVDPSEFDLYKMETGELLPRTKTLENCNVCDGTLLLIV